MLTNRRTGTIRRRVALSVTVMALVATACGSGQSSSGSVTLRYALWDDDQLPAYQQCADAFHQKNPNITVKITQTAWQQYWQNLTTQVVSGDAPDVFTDSVLYYPQLLADNQILDITDYVNRDHVDLAQYQPGLAPVWTKDGKRYGLPKDWDTIAIVYNADALRQAGIDPTALNRWTWNPTDGGDFGHVVAALTVDQNGHNGLDPAFDGTKVKTYGLAMDYESGAVGQDSWGNFAVSTGFSFTNANPFGTRYHYDDPRLSATIGWFAGLIRKGYLPPYEKQSTVGNDVLLHSGKAAMAITGDWLAKSYLTGTGPKLAIAPLPIGPAGRKSSINGLSDAIWAGTQHREQAWAWVKFLASTGCQDIVARQAVVFPAISEASAKAQAADLTAGRDMHVFVDEANAPNGTFVLPVTAHGDQINDIVQNAIDGCWLGQATATNALTTANNQVNNLMSH